MDIELISNAVVRRVRRPASTLPPPSTHQREDELILDNILVVLKRFLAITCLGGRSSRVTDGGFLVKAYLQDVGGPRRFSTLEGNAIVSG